MQKIIGLGLGILLGLLMLSVVEAQAQAPVINCQLGVDQPGAPTTCAQTALPTGITATAVESGHVMKAKPGTVSGFQVNNTNAAARWVMLINVIAVPSNGALTGCTVAQTSGCVVKWYQVAGSSTIGVSWSPGPPLQLNVGVVLVCSSTGPFTLTLAADCAFSGEIN